MLVGAENRKSWESKTYIIMYQENARFVFAVAEKALVVDQVVAFVLLVASSSTTGIFLSVVAAT